MISLFTGLDVPTSCRLTRAAFRDFNKGGPPLPLQLVNGNVLLDTGLGPTHAFKDIGQQVWTFPPTTRTVHHPYTYAEVGRGMGCVLVFLQTGRAVLRTHRCMG